TSGPSTLCDRLGVSGNAADSSRGALRGRDKLLREELHPTQFSSLGNAGEGEHQGDFRVRSEDGGGDRLHPAGGLVVDVRWVGKRSEIGSGLREAAVELRRLTEFGDTLHDLPHFVER